MVELNSILDAMAGGDRRVTPPKDAPLPSPLKRSDTDKVKCLSKCDGCKHQALLEDDTPACKLMRACGTPAPCRRVFLRRLDDPADDCPTGEWRTHGQTLSCPE